MQKGRQKISLLWVKFGCWFFRFIQCLAIFSLLIQHLVRWAVHSPPGIVHRALEHRLR